MKDRSKRQKQSLKVVKTDEEEWWEAMINEEIEEECVVLTDWWKALRYLLYLYTTTALSRTVPHVISQQYPKKKCVRKNRKLLREDQSAVPHQKLKDAPPSGPMFSTHPRIEIERCTTWWSHVLHPSKDLGWYSLSSLVEIPAYLNSYFIISWI